MTAERFSARAAVGTDTVAMHIVDIIGLVR
jgi:hypothetical protein